MSDLMSVREAEQKAGVTKQHIISLIKEGVIQGQKVGNAFVIERPSFDAWLEKRRQRQAQEQSGQSEDTEPEGARA